MSKELKTKIAFASILSLIPILATVKLNYISQDLGTVLGVIVTVLTLVFGKNYIKNMKQNNLFI